LAKDSSHTDFDLGQDESDLIVWLRRTGSTENGGPFFVVPGAFQPHRWTTVRLSVHGEHLQIGVDSATRLSQSLPKTPLSFWGPGRLVLGGEIDGTIPWQGEIRRAQVSTPGQSVDYAEPGAIPVPERYLFLPNHLQPFPATGADWLFMLLHLLSFIPIGFLLVLMRRSRIGPAAATMVAASIAVVLAAGKFLFDGRHAAVTDIVVQIVGALLGALCARWLLGRRARRAARRSSIHGEPCGSRHQVAG
jgi:VanZ family protein